jgi:hypothetical protein
VLIFLKWKDIKIFLLANQISSLTNLKFNGKLIDKTIYGYDVDKTISRGRDIAGRTKY